MKFGRNTQKSQFSRRFAFYELFVFKTGNRKNANFDAVSSKRGSFDAIQ